MSRLTERRTTVLVMVSAALGLAAVAIAGGAHEETTEASMPTFAGQPRSAQDSAANRTKIQLGPVDTYFVTQTSLGTPFQTDSGRIAEKRGGTQAIRSYASLMVSSHIEVNGALESITIRRAPVPPPTLLKAAYGSINSILEAEADSRFDAEYVHVQVAYQEANAALYQYEIDNGTDPDLKTFAQQTLPKIKDHWERALKLRWELDDR